MPKATIAIISHLSTMSEVTMEQKREDKKKFLRKQYHSSGLLCL